MRLWIICSGERKAGTPRRCTLEAYAALRSAALDGGAALEGGLRVAANGRRLYISPRACAAETATALVSGAEAEVEPMLDECRPTVQGEGKELPIWLCRFILWLRWLFGAGKKEARTRAAAAADRLERVGADAIIVSHPRFIAVLADVLRERGYCVQRTGFGSIKPLEQMLLSRRDEHCGGCAHNCLLSNPGCNIGRDKAARRSG